MISAVIIVLREVLEGVLLICMLMASAAAMGHRLRWLPVGLLLGVAGAYSYAVFLDPISRLFDGLGQEIISAVMLLSVALALVVYVYLIASHALRPAAARPWRAVLVLCLLASALSIAREGAEVYLYVYAFGVQAGQMASIMSGAVIGTGIGLSFGTFFYYGLRALSRQACLWTCAGIATMTAAGMVMQATYNLEQADVLPGQQPLWDTSALVRESSLTGEMLQAAFGYEATPTSVQLSLYLAAVLACLAAIALARLEAGRKQETSI
jgi:high-affinity iron transporter